MKGIASLIRIFYFVIIIIIILPFLACKSVGNNLMLWLDAFFSKAISSRFYLSSPGWPKPLPFEQFVWACSLQVFIKINFNCIFWMPHKLNLIIKYRSGLGFRTSRNTECSNMPLQSKWRLSKTETISLSVKLHTATSLPKENLSFSFWITTNPLITFP